MLNRTVAPPCYKIKRPTFTIPKSIPITKDIVLHSVSLGTQNVVQFDIVLESGIFYEKKPGLSYLTANMLLEGTKYKSFKQLADIIDHYGANIDISAGLDFLVISLSCLVRFLPKMLEVLEEIIQYPNFCEDRLNHLKSLKVQDILMDDSKTDRVAKKTLRSLIFSNVTPYGHILTKEDINSIDIKDINNFYNTTIFSKPKFFLSGLFEESVLGLVQDWIKNISGKFLHQDHTVVDLQNSQVCLSRNISIKDEPVQASICLGKLMPLKLDDDFIDVYLVNILLGGYFGSRLMKNIREVNGYTYGIYSNITTLRHASFILIAADVANDYLDATLEEIFVEVNKLRHEEISKSELKIMKSYLMGNLKRDMDNPLVVMDKFKALNLYGLNNHYYEELYDSIHTLDESRVHEIAERYFNMNQISQVVVR